MKNYTIEIKEPHQFTFLANILAKSKADLFLCIGMLLKIRPKDTTIEILCVSIEEEDWDKPNESKIS
jgi:hypothetical protein